MFNRDPDAVKIDPWKVTNGSFLMQNVGQRVSLLGIVNSTKTNPLLIEITTTDSLIVNISLKKPISVENESYIEVHGIVQSRNSILADRIINVPTISESKIDMNAYNQLVIFLNTFSDIWTIR